MSDNDNALYLGASDTLQERAAKILGEFANLRTECDHYRKALIEIENEGYPGNRPRSATLAWKALNIYRSTNNVRIEDG